MPPRTTAPRGGILASVTDELRAVQRGSDETVLVVEDEAIVRMLTVDALHDLGYRVLEAQDGPSGLQQLKSAARVDLLVTDVGLPGMNGRQLAEAARERWPELKVLFITGYAHNVAMAKGEALGPGMALIGKPFELAALTAKVRAMIESWAREPGAVLGLSHAWPSSRPITPYRRRAAVPTSARRVSRHVGSRRTR